MVQPSMPVHDFDFQRYVERRKGAREAERREGAVYAYGPDLRIRRVLARVRPVTLALEASVKLWQASARAELVGTSLRVTERSHPRVYQAAQTAAARLHVSAPAVHASPHPAISANTFGTDDEPVVLLHAALCQELSDLELLAVLGTEFGRLQNGGALLGTARHLLHHAPGGFLRWIVAPARTALDAWWRRGAITADRAGMIAARDLPAAQAAVRRVAEAARPAGDGGPTRVAATGSVEAATTADVTGRVAALEAFAGSAYYLGMIGESGGTSASDTDRRVAGLLKGAA
jgi:hypothetical protein